MGEGTFKRTVSSPQPLTACGLMFMRCGLCARLSARFYVGNIDVQRTPCCIIACGDCSPLCVASCSIELRTSHLSFAGDGPLAPAVLSPRVSTLTLWNHPLLGVRAGPLSAVCHVLRWGREAGGRTRRGRQEDLAQVRKDHCRS